MNTLEALVEECEASGVARRVLLLRPDRLPSGHVGMARAAMDALTHQPRARRHDLSADRLAVSWSGDNPGLRTALVQLADLKPADGPDLARLFELPRDAAALLAELEEEEPVSRRLPPRRGEPLDDRALERLELSLAQADLTRFLRRSRVIRQTSAGAQLAWEKRFVSLDELTATLAPGRDALADRSRLRRLCRSVDHRMLRLLSRHGELEGTGPFALNLNVGSVRGPEFARFDAALPTSLRGHVVLVLSLDDVLANPGAFEDARDEVGRQGYRVLLRGITAELADAVALDRMALHYVQLRWSPAMASRHLRLGPAQGVLAHVNGPAAVRWAAREGIELFQAAA